MNHLHFVLKRKSHRHRKNGSCRKDEECVEPTDQKSTIPPQCIYDYHSNTTLNQFNEELSNFCLPVEFQNHKGNHRSNESRCQSCGSQGKTPKCKRSCKRKSWTTNNMTQCKPHGPSLGGQSNNKMKEYQKSHPRKTFENSEREEKIEFGDSQDEKPMKTHEGSPFLSSSETNLGRNNQNKRNRMKLKKLYENESVMGHDNRRHSHNSSRRNRSRKRKCRGRHELQSNPYPSSSCMEDSQNQNLVIKKNNTKDSFEVLQTNHRKGHNSSSSEPIHSLRKKKSSKKNKGEGNMRQGKKIAFAEKESYRTFNSHEPPSSIGVPKKKNLPRTAKQKNDTPSETDDNHGNVPDEKITTDVKNGGEDCDNSVEIENFLFNA
ncbi:hypothetical protein WDU94_007869 [Cyamophila willieti]